MTKDNHHKSKQWKHSLLCCTHTQGSRCHSNKDAFPTCGRCTITSR